MSKEEDSKLMSNRQKVMLLTLLMVVVFVCWSSVDVPRIKGEEKKNEENSTLHYLLSELLFLSLTVTYLPQYLPPNGLEISS